MPLNILFGGKVGDRVAGSFGFDHGLDFSHVLTGPNKISSVVGIHVGRYSSSRCKSSQGGHKIFRRERYTQI